MSIKDGLVERCFCGGETVTVRAKKVATTAIEQVRKAIQMTPDCTTKEVTKLQAIQALISDIQQMQSKGYDWRASASLLSEHGIDINVVTLKSYLQRAKAGGAKARRKRRASHEADKRTPRGSGEAAREGAAKAAAAATRGPKEDAAAPALAAANRIPAGGAKAIPALGNDAASRRSAFVPEEDTDDL
jgi:hypothetical protein